MAFGPNPLVGFVISLGDGVLSAVLRVEIKRLARPPVSREDT